MTPEQDKFQEQLIQKMTRAIYENIIVPTIHCEELPQSMRFAALSAIFEASLAASISVANLSNFNIPLDDFIQDLSEGIRASYADIMDRAMKPEGTA